MHPIKSLRGIAVDAATVDDLGLALDRRWMLVDDGGVFLTQREDPSMTLLRTELVPAAGGDARRAELGHTVRVHAPSGDTLGSVSSNGVSVIASGDDATVPPAGGAVGSARIRSH